MKMLHDGKRLLSFFAKTILDSMETHKSIIAYSDRDQHPILHDAEGRKARFTGAAASSDPAARQAAWKNNKIFMTLKDLEQTVGGQIVYNPNVQSFALRQSIDTKP
ncbi:hypothetical protein [Paenibacillus oleatilyticus]|uniref:hypothetical protein n=1 Tax=Paenibacillus oleatilyticus TaxID=2594886 RepID=UPI001C1F7CCE|nr:hypothetical protein [Paenibacillus oleatilyticus]MBU7320372.1 hypothetical protein [Paenibacillus oleatilyticus]